MQGVECGWKPAGWNDTPRGNEARVGSGRTVPSPSSSSSLRVRGRVRLRVAEFESEFEVQRSSCGVRVRVRVRVADFEFYFGFGPDLEFAFAFEYVFEFQLFMLVNFGECFRNALRRFSQNALRRLSECSRQPPWKCPPGGTPETHPRIRPFRHPGNSPKMITLKNW